MVPLEKDLPRYSLGDSSVVNVLWLFLLRFSFSGLSEIYQSLIPFCHVYTYSSYHNTVGYYWKRGMLNNRKRPLSISKLPNAAAINAKENTILEPARIETEAMTIEIWSKTSA